MQRILVSPISSRLSDFPGMERGALITVYPRKNPIRLQLTQIQVILLDPVEAEKIAETVQSLLDASETEVEDEDAKRYADAPGQPDLSIGVRLCLSMERIVGSRVTVKPKEEPDQTPG